MKPIIKSRSEYGKKLKELDHKKICGFCNIKPEFIIKEYKNWLWVFSEFPYWKYNTIVICKKHKVTFSELAVDEMTELKSIFAEAEDVFLKAKIIKKHSSWGVDILWRQRIDTSGYKTRSHIHIHLCPQKEGRFVDILDPNSHKINPSKLLEVVHKNR